MTDTKRPLRPWDAPEYQRIVSASYRDGELVVGFADGTDVRLPPRDLVAPDAPSPDWSRLRADELHLVVPSPAGDFEIPWDVIRVRTDPEFDAFWAALAAKYAGAVTSSPVEPSG